MRTPPFPSGKVTADAQNSASNHCPLYRLTHCVILAALLLGGSPVLHGATVTTSGRQLRVNGQPFTVKGVNYSPVPQGYTAGFVGSGCQGPYHWWQDGPTYTADFPQIRRLGANTLRTFDLMNSTSTASQVLQALDAAQANGLYVIMGYYASHSANVSDASFRTQTLAEFVAAVNAYKAHPAVLMWAFGNENNLDNGNTNPAWYSLVQLAAQQAKAADPAHPVMTVEGECLGPDCGLAPGDSFSFLKNIGNTAIGADDTTLSGLDVWGINVYRGYSFNGVFQALASSTMTVKPILVTEFGKDAWYDPSAAENQYGQASYLTSQWQEINTHLSAAGSGSANLAGGVVFEWSDEWWKDSGNDCQIHGAQVLFHRASDTLDPNYQDEWFGITSAVAINALPNPNGSIRPERIGFSALQAFWNPGGAAPPSAAQRNFFADSVRNFPNPFQVGTAPTKFVALVNEAGTIDIRIYDASKHFVTSLTPVNAAGPGRHEMLWDGRDRQGAYVSPGLYYARIEGKGASHSDEQVRRVVAVK